MNKYFLIRDLDSNELVYLNVQYLASVERYTDGNQSGLVFSLVNGHEFRTSITLAEFEELIGLQVSGELPSTIVENGG